MKAGETVVFNLERLAFCAKSFAGKRGKVPLESAHQARLTVAKDGPPEEHGECGGANHRQHTTPSHLQFSQLQLFVQSFTDHLYKTDVFY